MRERERERENVRVKGSFRVVLWKSCCVVEGKREGNDMAMRSMWRHASKIVRNVSSRSAVASNADAWQSRSGSGDVNASIFAAGLAVASTAAAAVVFGSTTAHARAPAATTDASYPPHTNTSVVAATKNGGGGIETQKDQEQQQQQHNRYKVFLTRGDGECASINALVDRLIARQVDVVLLGEFHDDSVAHELEQAFLKRAHVAAAENRRRVILSLEMLERDVQHVVDEWLRGAIRDQDLFKDARVWPNHVPDYHALLEFAKENKVEVLAANAPRRYVSLAGREGREEVVRLFSDGVGGGGEDYSTGFKAGFLPPMPWAHPSDAYATRIDEELRAAAVQLEEHGHGAGKITATNGECPYIGRVTNSFTDAQSLWDASMAWTIAQGVGSTRRQEVGSQRRNVVAASAAAEGKGDDMGDDAKPLVVHVCGQFHCGRRLGIPEHLAVYAPDAKVAVVVIEPISNIVDGVGNDVELGRERISQYTKRTLAGLGDDDAMILTVS